MNIARLNHLDTILTNVPCERFSLKRWQCGATACAIGHVGADPAFMSQGFHIEGTRLPFSATPFFRPVFVDADRKYAEWEAVMQFFDLTSEQVMYLFSSDSYPELVRPEDVIAHIRELIAKEAMPA
jgi:hypothetical protein